MGPVISTIPLSLLKTYLALRPALPAAKNIYKETTRCEDAVRTLTNELKSNEIISEHLSKELNPTGSRPGIMYGLPKVHKPNSPLRPIISAIGTHSYKLAKFLLPLLRPFSTNTFTINDTFTFVKELCELKINTNYVIMASFDVKSLFTNILLDETINITRKYMHAATPRLS
jgi:hypothetical protein